MTAYNAVYSHKGQVAVLPSNGEIHERLPLGVYTFGPSRRDITRYVLTRTDESALKVPPYVFTSTVEISKTLYRDWKHKSRNMSVLCKGEATTGKSVFINYLARLVVGDVPVIVVSPVMDLDKAIDIIPSYTKKAVIIMEDVDVGIGISTPTMVSDKSMNGKYSNIALKFADFMLGSDDTNYFIVMSSNQHGIPGKTVNKVLDACIDFKQITPTQVNELAVHYGLTDAQMKEVSVLNSIISGSNLKEVDNLFERLSDNPDRTVVSMLEELGMDVPWYMQTPEEKNTIPADKNIVYPYYTEFMGVDITPMFAKITGRGVSVVMCSNGKEERCRAMFSGRDEVFKEQLHPKLPEKEFYIDDLYIFTDPEKLLEYNREEGYIVTKGAVDFHSSHRSRNLVVVISAVPISLADPQAEEKEAAFKVKAKELHKRYAAHASESNESESDSVIDSALDDEY